MMNSYSLITLKEGLIAVDAHSMYSAWIMAQNMNLTPIDIYRGELDPELN